MGIGLGVVVEGVLAVWVAWSGIEIFGRLDASECLATLPEEQH
jgi:hypothetical protein